MEATFLEPGFGGSVVVRTPEGAFVVVDPGPSASGEKLVEFLDECGAREVTAVLTNSSLQRVGGVKALVESLKLDRIVRGSAGWTAGSERVSVGDARRRGIPEMSLSAGDRLGLSQKVALEVLSPPVSLIKGSPASNSLVVRIRYGGVSVLMMSDAGMEAEGYLISSEKELVSDVLVVGGNGDNGSTSLELISLVRPKHFVVRAGGAFGRPSRALLSRIGPEHTGAQVHRTDTDGRTVMVTDGHTTVLRSGERARD